MPFQRKAASLYRGQTITVDGEDKVIRDLKKDYILRCVTVWYQDDTEPTTYNFSDLV